MHRLLLIIVACVFSAIRLFGNEALVSDDATTTSATPGKNLGASALLTIGPKDKAFIRFDLSALPANLPANQIAKATLQLWVSAATGTGSVGVVEVTAPWTESKVTNATAPSIAPAPSASFAVTKGVKKVYVSANVTALVQGWVTAAAPNYGLALLAGTGAAAQFDSKENMATSHEPRLEIVLAGPPGIQGIQGMPGPATAATLPSGTPVLLGPSDAIPAGYTPGGVTMTSSSPVVSALNSNNAAQAPDPGQAAVIGNNLYILCEGGGSEAFFFTYAMDTGASALILGPSPYVPNSTMCAGPDQALYFLSYLSTTRFDPVSGQTTTLATMPQGLQTFDAVLVGANFYVAGFPFVPQGQTSTPVFYQFDPVHNLWTSLPNPPPAFATGLSVGTAAAFYNMADPPLVYAPTLGQWNQFQTPSRSLGANPFSDGTYIYEIAKAGTPAEIQRFDPGSQLWTTVGLLDNSFGARPLLANGMVYLDYAINGGVAIQAFPWQSVRQIYVSP